eukprot:GHVN01088887.1.p1 GENE.GHVN01088887.1~~GHVN01088887.1.p1  ORF type:complete len:388 (+),score=33.35 GHVN01088887.1:71-1234(+)
MMMLRGAPFLGSRFQIKKGLLVYFVHGERFSTAKEPKKQISYYEILKVTANATDDEIREAYIRQVKELHPDSRVVRKGRDEDVDDFMTLQKAFEALRAPESRKSYDRQLQGDPLHRRAFTRESDGFDFDPHAYRQKITKQRTPQHQQVPRGPGPQEKSYWQNKWDNETEEERKARYDRYRAYAEDQSSTSHNARSQTTLYQYILGFVLIPVLGVGMWSCRNFQISTQFDEGEDIMSVYPKEWFLCSQLKGESYMAEAFHNPFLRRWERIPEGYEAPSPEELVEFYKDDVGKYANVVVPKRGLTEMRMPKWSTDVAVLLRDPVSGYLGSEADLAWARSLKKGELFQEATVKEFDGSQSFFVSRTRRKYSKPFNEEKMAINGEEVSVRM